MSVSMDFVGFMISGAVHLHAPAVLVDVNLRGSMTKAKP